MHPRELLLVRHGETDWNRDGRAQGHTDVPLNEEGRRQMRALAARLRGREIDALHASDLARAVESARILGDALGLEPQLSPVWREMRLGSLEGAPGEELRRRYLDLVAATARMDQPIAEGGESFADLRERLLAGYSRICREHEGQTVLLVGHGGTLKALVAILLEFGPQHIERLSLRGNAGLSLVDYSTGRPRLALLNDTSHWERA